MSLAAPVAVRPAHTPRRLAPPIHVGFVLHRMQVAGAEVLVARTIRRLSQRIAPVVFCLDDVGPLGHDLIAEGVPVIALHRRPGRDWGLARRLADAFAAYRIEVVHAHQYSPFFYAALARLLCRPAPRLILTEHGRHFPDQVSRLRYWVNRLGLSRLADDVNAVCKFSARALCERDGFARAPVGVIPNGIDPERYGTTANRAALRARLGLDANRDYVIHVARMHPVKDHPTLLHAFAQVATTHANVDLLLAGDGPGRDDLEALAARLGISARVRFLGVRQDVPDLLNAADIFTLPSISEAASLTLLEAMAAGLPAVVTDVGGNGEIVRAGVDGLLVPRGDASALAQAFRRLLDDPSERTRMGRSGQERVRSDYRLDNTIDAYMSMYQRFVRTRGR